MIYSNGSIEPSNRIKMTSSLLPLLLLQPMLLFIV